MESTRTNLTSTAALGSSCVRMSSADTLLLSFFVRAKEKQPVTNNPYISKDVKH